MKHISTIHKWYIDYETKNGLMSHSFSKQAEVPEIKITDKEKQIFDILLGAIQYFGLKSTIRVAGGWVRDKVMGKSSKDIDIAVDNMSGKDFAEKALAYARMQGVPAKSVGVIEARPDQSKHLETAVVNLLDESIDFVNLRAEKYDEKTRIPQMVPGTALEDAYRRDFTINALFYNINDGKVEDLTGTGVEDIKNGIIRTPIPPKEIWTQVGITDESQVINPKKTFMDDPLRILRAIRFASRYGFKLAPELMDAAKDPEVQESFRGKISRERIEAELRKMVAGPSPVWALQLIKELGLRSEVLKLPEGTKEWEMDQNNPHHQLNIWDHISETLSNLQQIVKDRNLNDADKFAVNLAAFLHDVGKLDPKIHGTKEIEGKIVSTYHGHEESSIAIAEYMLKNLPGVRTEEIERIKKLIDAARRVNPARQESSEVANMTRKQLGNFVRMIGDDWENAIDIAMADASAKKKDWLSTYDPTYYKSLKEQIKGTGLEKAHTMKPLLTGDELMKLFARKGGKWVGALNKELIQWQLENPTATKDDAIASAKQLYQQMDLAKSADFLISKRATTMPFKKEYDSDEIRVEKVERAPEPKVEKNISEDEVRELIKKNPTLFFSYSDFSKRFPELERTAAEELSKQNPEVYFISKLQDNPKYQDLNEIAIGNLLLGRPKLYFTMGLFDNEKFADKLGEAIRSVAEKEPQFFLEVLLPLERFKDFRSLEGVAQEALKKSKASISKRAGVIDVPKKMLNEIYTWALPMREKLLASYQKTYGDRQLANLEKAYKIKTQGGQGIGIEEFAKDLDINVSEFNLNRLMDFFHGTEKQDEPYSPKRDYNGFFDKLKDGSLLTDAKDESSPRDEYKSLNVDINNENIDVKLKIEGDTLRGVPYVCFPSIHEVSVGVYKDIRLAKNDCDDNMMYEVFEFAFDRGNNMLEVSIIDETSLNKELKRFKEWVDVIVGYAEDGRLDTDNNDYKFTFDRPKTIKRKAKYPEGFGWLIKNNLQSYMGHLTAVAVMVTTLSDHLQSKDKKVSTEPYEVAGKLHSSAEMHFKIDLTDTKQYQEFKKELEEVLQKSPKVKVILEIGEKSKGWFDSVSPDNLPAIYILEDAKSLRSESELLQTLSHELIHLVQDLLTRAIKLRNKYLKEKKWEAGLPGKYDPKSYQFYTARYEKDPEYSKQHALSDVEFFTRLEDAMGDMRWLVRAYPITAFDIPYMSPQDPKIPLKINNLYELEKTERLNVMKGRFERYLKDDKTLKYLRKYDPTKFNKMIRELYRGFDEVTKSASISKRAKPKKHEKAGLFILVPKDLAKEFPSLGEHDDSKPHITALFIGEVPKKHEDLLEKTVKEVLAEQEPFDVELDSKVSYFPASKHSDGCKIAKLKVVSNDLHEFHDKLKEAISNAGIEIDDHFPDYKPHITLSYLPKGEDKYEGSFPSGSWVVKGVELWDSDYKKKFKFGNKKISKRQKDGKSN